MELTQTSIYDNLHQQLSRDSNHFDPENQELPERPEESKRQKIRALFDAIDADGDEHITRRELKNYIKAHKPHALTSGISKKILKMADGDGNGRLDFEEFYLLTKHAKLNWLFQYVNLVEPPRNDGNIDENDRYGAYENMMKCWPLPIMMILFSVLEIAVYFVDEYFSEWTIEEGNLKFRFLSYYLQYDYNKRNEVWRFVTYMFVHSNIWHLTGNVLFQLFLGIPIEMLHRWRVTVVYLSGVLLGCMGASIFNHKIYLVGASGGVYALVTAHIAIVILNWRQMRLAFVNLFICLVYCITDFSTALLTREENNKVSFLSHLFGAIAGLLVGIGVLRNLEVKSWEKKLWWMAVGLYTLIMAAGIIYHVEFYK